LGLPVLAFGVGYGANLHGPDEFIVIDADPPVRGLADLEHFNFPRGRLHRSTVLGCLDAV
jgi:hypothetical protein